MNERVFNPPQAVVTIDARGTIVELDHGAEEVLGLRRSEVLGRPIAEIIIPQRLESDHWIRVRKAPPGTQPGDVSQAVVELTIRRRDEGHKQLLASSRDLPDQGSDDFESALHALLESAEQMGQMGSWDWHLETNQLLWSDNLYRIFGLVPGEITPSPEYVFERTHPNDRERVQHEVESARREGRLRPLEYRITQPDGVVRHLYATQAVVELADGRPRRIVGSVQDITDRRRAERTIAAHLAVAKSLGDWQTLEQGAMGLLRNIAEGLDCVAGVLWLPEGDVLVAHVIWSSDSTDVSALESLIRQLRLPKGVGLAGQVWETGEPITVLSLEDDARFSVEAVGSLRGALALPAAHAGEVLAVLEFYVCESVTADGTDRLLRSLTGIGYELGLFLAHHRGELKPSSLTPRELEVLQLAAQGSSGREIAERLVVSPATVRRHFENIYDKYGVSDRAAAVAQALREGLIV